jgi:hypothetical protein
VTGDRSYRFIAAVKSFSHRVIEDVRCILGNVCLAQLINYQPDMEVTGEAENTNQKYLKFSHMSPFPVGSLVMRVQPS